MSDFPTVKWYGVSDACADCHHAKAAHGADGCIASVNVYQGGWSRATSGNSRTGIVPGASHPGALAYSYPCDCKRSRR
jgi:hypothetical protein